MSWVDNLQPQPPERDPIDGPPSPVDPRTCPHKHSEPVEVRDQVTGDVAVVARICTFCHAELSAAWGCTRCQWVQNRRLCDPTFTLVLAVPCQEHA